jgi:histone-lysine N-methyltransferase SETMAR
MMLTVVWNSHGFHFLDVLPNASKFSAGREISHILLRLRENFASDQDDPRRQFVIRADNARLYCAKILSLFLDRNSPRRAFHPPYSPDMASSDFRLSGFLKAGFQGSSFNESDELLSGIQQTVRGADRETLDAVFQEWMITLQNCIDGNGEYVE